jgi:serine/threonine-protein kinase
MVELRVLGPISLTRADGSNVTPLLAQPKRLAVAAYLASPPPHGGRCLHRKDSLVAMFWPELDQQHARAALRNTLYFLRQHLGTESVVAEHDVVGLDPNHVWCDLEAFDVAVRMRDHATTYQLYRGPLLDGLCVTDAEAFDEWLDAQRRRRATEVREAATHAARRHAAAGRPEDALVWARRARLMDPLNEDAARLVIALRFVTGDRAGALDEYRRLEAQLDAEHGVPPSSDSRRLAQVIRDPDADPATVGHAIAQVPLPSAVAQPVVAGGPRPDARRFARVRDRAVLEAVLQTRIGLACRRGSRVGIIALSFGAPAPAGLDVDAAMRHLEVALLPAIRAADLVARVDDGTLMILPSEDGAGDVSAMVGRVQRQLAAEARSGGPSDRPSDSAPVLEVHWLDPAVSRNAAELLAALLAAR